MKTKDTKHSFLYTLQIFLGYFLLTPFCQAEDFLTLTPGASTGSTSMGPGGPRQYILEDPQLSDISTLLSHAIKFMLSLAGLAAVFLIFFGAFTYVSGMTIEQKSKGKMQIVYAIIGLVVITLSYIFVQVLTSML